MGQFVLHDFNLEDFNRALEQCTGDVFMVTPEGDRLNLKSKLCQLIGFSTLLQSGEVTQATLECSDPADAIRLARFNYSST